MAQDKSINDEANTRLRKQKDPLSVARPSEVPKSTSPVSSDFLEAQAARRRPIPNLPETTATPSAPSRTELMTGKTDPSPETPDVAKTSEAPEGGLSLNPVVAATVAAAVVTMVNNYQTRNDARMAREQGQQNFNTQIEQQKIDRELAQQAAQRAAIGNVGTQAAQGAARQGSALSQLASLFGGL